MKKIFLLIILIFLIGCGNSSKSNSTYNLNKNNSTLLSIYIWSKGFNEYNNSFINKILKENNITNVILSSSAEQNKTKFLDFIKNKKYELIISNNNYIFPEKREDLLNKIKTLSQYTSTIHLDIEPHTFDDFKENNTTYYEYYIDMLKDIKKNFPNITINISIPTFYDLNYTTQMKQYTDKIYLMAYEFKNYSQLKRRVDRYKNLNIVITLSYKDFNNSQQLFNTIKQLKTDYKNFAIHHLRGLISLLNQ